LDGDEARERFERLVSEAATTAVDYLDRGYEVELVTRDRAIRFGAGRRQRATILEHLAVIEPAERSQEPLRSRDPGAPRLRIQAGSPSVLGPDAEPPPPARPEGRGLSVEPRA
jgi:uncharacterized protein (DUF58 family)